MTLCGLPLGLLESQLLDASQMQWSPAFAGAEVCHARTPTKVFEVCPNDSSSGTPSTRQATVESDFLSGIGGPLPDAKLVSCLKMLAVSEESRGAGTPSCASPRPARWQLGGQRKPATNTGHYLFRSSHE